MSETQVNAGISTSSVEEASEQPHPVAQTTGCDSHGMGLWELCSVQLVHPYMATPPIEGNVFGSWKVSLSVIVSAEWTSIKIKSQ